MDRSLTLFNAIDSSGKQALWRTDGIVTAELLTLNPLSGSFSIGPLFPLNGGQVLFNGYEGSSDSALWVSNGTVPGTRAISPVNRPGFFFALGGGAALFQGNDPGGRALWRTDGTAAGTFALSVVKPGGAPRFSPPIRGSLPVSNLNDPNFTALGNGTVMFIGEDASLGRELWRTDGTAAGTVLLADLAPGDASGDPYDFTPLGDGRAVFGANRGFPSGEVWITDGTAAGTVRLATVRAASFLSLGDGRALFAGDDVVRGNEPWITDGTAAGTVPLADLTPGTSGSFPRDPVLVRAGLAVFVAQTSGGCDYGIWSTDGTAAGTVQIGTYARTGPFVSATGSAPLGNGHVALAFGADPYRGSGATVFSDGTAAGTVVLDGVALARGFTPIAGGRALFFAEDAAGASGLWTTDGTAAGTVRLAAVSGSQLASDGQGRFLFAGYDPARGNEPWITDGTAAGTRLLADLVPGDVYSSSFPASFSAIRLDDTPRNLVGTAGDDVLAGAAGDDTVSGGAGNDALTGGEGNDLLIPGAAAPGGQDAVDGGFGYDIAVLDGALNSYAVLRRGTTLTLSGPNGRAVIENVELLRFGNGAVGNTSPDRLVDPFFYGQTFPQTFRANADPAQDYHQTGWLLGRDPNPLFSTTGYLSANADVRASRVDPLDHYRDFGAGEDRDPSATFDAAGYLARNPDVARSGINPLEHYLDYGAAEERAITPSVGHAIRGGFDAEFYFLANPDVGLSGADAYAHWTRFGLNEQREPNAYFSTGYYRSLDRNLATAGVNPLDHYLEFGWRENRDPSPNFSTAGYLAANPDVAAAGVNPLDHYLRHGHVEGRLPVSVADYVRG